MAGLVDYHLHSRFSGDALETDLLEMCRKSVEMGLSEIAFTEHVDFDPTDDCYEFYDYEGAIAEVERARATFGDRLRIRRGVEVDYQPKYHDQIVAFLSGRHFDYVVGSAHYLDGLILINPAYFEGRPEERTYPPYFGLAEKVAASGLFDSLAHLEFCKRLGARYYGPFRFERYRDRIERVLRVVIDLDMALEINTAGFRQDPGEAYPSIQTLRLFRELGGRRVVIGSDAHRVEHVGFAIERGYAIAREAGFTEMATFQNRKCAMVPIPDVSEARR